MSTIDDIIKTVQRFRILCVGRSGVGKSRLINVVFGIDKALVSHIKPGEADIDKEFSSEQNKFFFLHDSKGFEPGDTTTFDIVTKFILERCEKEELKDRLHAIWLCTDTPTAGGRVFEAGDEKLVQLAQEKGIPILVVLTQYDRLVRTKIMRLRGKNLTTLEAQQQGETEAAQALDICVKSLEGSMKRLKISIPRFANVSVHPEYKATVSKLVEITCEVVQKELKNEAWLMWAIAQRASLPVKINACVDKGVNYYHTALCGTIPGVAGKTLLQECLTHVHKDIVTCWNLKNEDELLNDTNFKHLMLYLIQDIYESQPQPKQSQVHFDKLSQFVALITTVSLPVASPIAILGLSFIFVKWVSEAFLDNIPMVERIIMAYTVDLILVLKSLFDFTLKPDLAGSATWEVLKDAFEDYQCSQIIHKNHTACRSAVAPNDRLGTLDRAAFRAKIREILGEKEV